MIERTTDSELLGNSFGLKIKPVDLEEEGIIYDQSARHIYDFNDKRLLISSNVPCQVLTEDGWVDSDHFERVIIQKNNISAVVLNTHPMYHIPCVTILAAGLNYETLFSDERDALEFHHLLDKWL